MRLLYPAMLLVLPLLAACAAPEFTQNDGMKSVSDSMLAAASPSSPPSSPAFESPAATQPGQAGQGASAAPAAQDRLIIYSASYSLVVPDIRAATASLQSTATSMGGYLLELTQDSITLRIPAPRLPDALAAVEKLGNVTGRTVHAADVTDEMRDLNIRLGNASAVRERLLALIDKSAKMQDTIELEKELERVTETIELLKGKLQSMQHQIAYSTLRIQLNSPLPQRQVVEQIPFAWVRDLGNGITAGNIQATPDTSRWSARNTRFTLPDGFIRYYERDNLTEAMAADGVIIRLQRQDNYDGGKLSFWAPVCRKSIVENNVIAPTAEQDITLDTGAIAHVIQGTRDAAPTTRGYLIAIAVTDRRIYTFESWGPKEAFDKDLPLLQIALKSLRVGKW